MKPIKLPRTGNLPVRFKSRAVLRDVLGTVRIEDREDGTYAVMKRPTVALLAVAGVSGYGSGGRILDLEIAVQVS